MEQDFDVERYLAFRRQGLSHEEAIREAATSRPQTRRTTPQTPRRQTPRGDENEGFLDAVGEFGEGVGLGATRAVTSLGEGTGFLLGKVPGLGGVGGRIEDFSENVEDFAENIFTPEGGAGTAGEIVGRLGGEVATTLGTFGVGRAITPAKYLASLQRVAGGSRLAGATAAVAAESPLSLARAASWSQDRGTGFGEELALEIAGSALGGAFLGGARRNPKIEVDESLLEGVTSVKPGKLAKRKKRKKGGPKPLMTGMDRFLRGMFDEYRPFAKLGLRSGGLRSSYKVEEQVARLLGSQKAAELQLAQTMRPWILANRDNLDVISDAALIRREHAIRFSNMPGRTARMKNIEDDEIIRRWKEIKKNKELWQATSDLMGFARKNLNDRHAAGIVSDLEMDKILKSSKAKRGGKKVDNYYIPMVSVDTGEISDEAFEAMALTKGLVNKIRPQKGVDTLEKGKKTHKVLESPVNLIAWQTYRTFDDVARQRLGRALSEIMDEGALSGSNLLEGIVRPLVRKDGNPFSQKHIKGLINKGDIEKDKIWEFMDKGVRKSYHIEDEDLFKALKGTPTESSHITTEILRKVANFKRNSITIVPDFAVASLLRDWPMFAVQRMGQRGARAAIETVGGGAIGATAGAATADTPEEQLQRAVQFGLAGLGAGALGKPGLELAQGVGTYGRGELSRNGENFIRRTAPAIADILGGVADMFGMDKQLYNEFVSRASVTAGQAYGSRSATTAGKVIDGMTPELKESIIAPLAAGGRGFLEALRVIGMSAENAPRIAQYRALTRGAEGKIPGKLLAEAPVWAAQDVTLPFGRRGSWKAVKYATKITPFLNAQMQGWAKLGRLFRGDPEKSALKGATQSLTAMGATITAPTVALWMTNKDNPEYWDRPLWERNLFWLIPKPDGGFHRIPKPFELGYVFASLPERVLDQAAMAGTIPSGVPRGLDTASEVAASLMSFATSNVTGTLPIPAGAQPFIEQAANRDLFRWKPLEPEYLQDRPAERRTTKSTPILANSISQSMKDLTGYTMSPLRIEGLIQSFGGTTGRRAMEMVDMAGAASDDRTPMSRLTPEERLSRVVGTARFSTQQYDIGNIEFSAWNILDRAKSIQDEYNRMRRAGMNRRALSAYREDYLDELILAQRSKTLLQAMTEIRSQRNQLLSSERLPQAQLRARLDRLTAQGRRQGLRAFRLIDRTVK